MSLGVPPPVRVPRQMSFAGRLQATLRPPEVPPATTLQFRYGKLKQSNVPVVQRWTNGFLPEYRMETRNHCNVSHQGTKKTDALCRWVNYSGTESQTIHVLSSTFKQIQIQWNDMCIVQHGCSYVFYTCTSTMRAYTVYLNNNCKMTPRQITFLAKKKPTRLKLGLSHRHFAIKKHMTFDDVTLI